jgi:hypothetical protein
MTPLPKYLPASLFSDLNLPELIIQVPETPQRKLSRDNKAAEPISLDQPATRDENMELAQALQEFAPGNISKRFSRKEYIKESHWLNLPDEAQLSRSMLPLQYLKIDFHPIPEEIFHIDRSYQVYRPMKYYLDSVPMNVKDTSSARLIWKSDFTPLNEIIEGLKGSVSAGSEREGTDLAVRHFLTTGSPWLRLIKNIQSFTHVQGACVKVTRFAIGVELDTRFEHGNQIRRRLLFEENGEPAGIGFSLHTDAIRFELEPLDIDTLFISPEWPRLIKTLIGNYFKYRLSSDLRISEANLSNFEIEWLWQLELSMLTAVAIAKNISLQEAASEVSQNRLPIADRTMRVIFQSQRQSEMGEEDIEGRLFKKLIEYQSTPAILDAICDCETVLWSQPDTAFFNWLQKCYSSSLGAVIYAAITQLIPDIQSEELVMDLAGDTVWISETSAGGIGLISKIADAISQYPRNFELELDDCVQYCEREHLAGQLELISEKLEHGQTMIQYAFDEVRVSTDLPKLESSRILLTQALKFNGYLLTAKLSWP